MTWRYYLKERAQYRETIFVILRLSYAVVFGVEVNVMQLCKGRVEREKM